MNETSRTGNPFFDAWMAAGRRFMESGLAPAPGTNVGQLSELASRAEENWQLCQRQAADWALARDGLPRIWSLPQWLFPASSVRSSSRFSSPA